MGAGQIIEGLGWLRIEIRANAAARDAYFVACVTYERPLVTYSRQSEASFLLSSRLPGRLPLSTRSSPTRCVAGGIVRDPFFIPLTQHFGYPLVLLSELGSMLCRELVPRVG